MKKVELPIAARASGMFPRCDPILANTHVPSQDGSRRLNCLIQGESNTFLVPVGLDCVVSELKKEIQKERKLGVLKDVDPQTLELWKVNVDLKHHNKHTLGRLKIENLEGVEELELTWETILQYWPDQPPPKHLHVIIKVPTLKRPHSPYTTEGAKHFRPNTDDLLIDDWLIELHSKIWNREALVPELFRKTCVTRRHYELLQSHLEKRYPNDGSSCSKGDKPSSSHPIFRAGSSSSPDSDLLVKLQILRSTDAPSPGSPLSNTNAHQSDQSHVEDVNDVDDELDSLFPTTIQYMDLSSLGLQKRTKRLPQPLLFREEYAIISDMIEDLPEDANGCVVVSGQPGTGKTAFLHLMVVEYMLLGKAFLYQNMEGAVCHVSQALTPITSWSSSENPIVAFVDADQSSLDPKPFICLPNVKLIVASSPHGAERSWTKQTGSTSHVTKLIMALWSPSELFLTGLFLCDGPATYARLAEVVSYTGCNPRLCFTACRSWSNLNQLQQSIQSKIRGIAHRQTISSLLTEDFLYNRVSHTIFQLSPADDWRVLHGARVEPVSNWALNKLLIEYELRQEDAAAELYMASASMQHGGTLRGRLWERQVLKYLDSCQSPQTFTIRSLANSTVSQWTYPAPVTRVDFLSPSFTPSLRLAVDTQQPRHLVPLDLENFPTLNSVLYDPAGPFTCIQVTTRKKHPELVSGFKRVQGWLKQKTPLASLRPSTSGNHWYLLFVVPEDIASAFELQEIEGDTEQNEWARKVDQYVLGLKEDVVWGRKLSVFSR